MGQRVKSVYHCQVLGERGSGKSTFVRGLIGKEQVTWHDPSIADIPYYELACVQMVVVRRSGEGEEEEEEEEEEAVTIRSLPVAGSTVYLIVGSASRSITSCRHECCDLNHNQGML